MSGGIHFASDNNAGVCPAAWARLQEADAQGHLPAYGQDDWTQRAARAVRAVFETDCEVHFVFNGTAANALALASICRPYEAIICHPVAHIETDECHAPAFFSGGARLIAVQGTSPAAREGKLTPQDVESAVARHQGLRHPVPRAVSLTQATELGTVYTPDEVAAIARTAADLGLKVHMDGARFANAVAGLGVAPADLTWRAGVDVLSFGGTKNGLPFGEAVVFFDRALAQHFGHRAKQGGQLASKMRYLAAPWLGLLEGEVWLANARHANAMAQRLHDAIRALPGVQVLHPVQANGVFVALPRHAIDAMHARGWRFYEFMPGGGCRLMCAWDTTAEVIDAFAADLARCVE